MSFSSWRARSPGLHCEVDHWVEYCQYAVETTLYRSPLVGEVSPTATWQTGSEWDAFGGGVGADVDGDGDLDELVLLIDGSTTPQAVYALDLDGSYLATSVGLTALGYWSDDGTVTDIDGDGIEDLWMFGTYWPGPLSTNISSEFACSYDSTLEFGQNAADLDGDGVREVIAYDMAVGFGVGPAPDGLGLPFADYATGTFACALCKTFSLIDTGDVDGDGDEELLFELDYATGATSVAIWDGPVEGDRDLTESRAVWDFDASLGLYPLRISPEHGGVMLAWVDAGVGYTGVFRAW